MGSQRVRQDLTIEQQWQQNDFYSFLTWPWFGFSSPVSGTFGPDIPILAIHQLTYSLYQWPWNNWAFAGRIEVPPQTHGMCRGKLWLLVLHSIPLISLHHILCLEMKGLTWIFPLESGVLSNIRARQIFTECDSWPLSLTMWLTLAKRMFIDVILANSRKRLEWAWPFEVTVIAVRAYWSSLMEDEWEERQIESELLPQISATELRGQGTASQPRAGK